MRGISSEYDNIKLCIYCDPSFDLDKMQATIRNVNLDEILGKAKTTIVS